MAKKTVAKYDKFKTEMNKLIEDRCGFGDRDEREIKAYFDKWGSEALVEIHYDGSGRLLKLKSRLGNKTLDLWP